MNVRDDALEKREDRVDLVGERLDVGARAPRSMTGRRPTCSRTTPTPNWCPCFGGWAEEVLPGRRYLAFGSAVGTLLASYVLEEDPPGRG